MNDNKSTPKQIGDELVGKMLLHTYSLHSKDDGRRTAIICAIIAVEEIIKETQGHNDRTGSWQDEDNCYSVIDRLIFWTKVLEYLKTL